MPNFKSSLSDAYKASDSATSSETYTVWAETYDSETIQNGYQVPFVGAAFLDRHIDDRTRCVLDAGCGTGLAGRILTTLGYADIVGLDVTPGMLALAEQSRAYSRLVSHDLANPLPFDTGAFTATICLGSFGPGHAPPSALGDLARVTAPGGVLVFNLREDTHEAQGFPEVLASLSDNGTWELVETSDPFRAFLLSEPDLMTKVYVFRILT